MISSSMSPPYLPLVVCLSRHSSAHSIRRAQRYGVDEVSDVRSDGCEERVIAAEHPSQRPKTRPTFLRLVSRPFPTVTFLLTSSQSVNRVFSIHISFPTPIPPLFASVSSCLLHLTHGGMEWEWNEMRRVNGDD